MATRKDKKQAEVSLPFGETIPALDLTKQLLAILVKPDVLPSADETPIFGTKLVGVVKKHLKGEFSDNSIKNYFSQLSQDATSPIAKSTQGFGYFRRKTTELDIESPTEFNVDMGIDDDTADFDAARDLQFEEKFRSIYMLWLEANKCFPAHIEHTKSLRSTKGLNTWKFSDVVSLSWNVAVSSESSEELELDKSLLEIKKSIGDSPFSLTSAELKVSLTFGNFRQCFFQCVSNSKWANEAHLVVAQKIADSKLVDGLRKLGASFGVSIISFQLNEKDLEELPSAAIIKSKIGSERDELLAKYGNNVNVIYSALSNDQLDWDHIEDVRSINNVFSNVFKWVSRCLKDNKAHTLGAFMGLQRRDLNDLRQLTREYEV